MLMSEVLAKKGDNVFKILSSKTVMDAIIGMTSFKVGAVLVVDDSDKMVGIFTERDVTRILAAHGATVVEAPVALHMTPDPVTCTKADPVTKVLDIMSKNRFRHMPIVENGELLGIVSIRDLVNERLEHCQFEADSLRAYVTA